MVTKVNVPIFRGKLTVVINETLEESANEIDYRKDISDYNAISFYGRYDGVLQFVILLHKGVDTGIIAHESAHAANQILDYIGHNNTADNDEVFCYVFEWVFRQAEKCFNKYKEKHGKS